MSLIHEMKKILPRAGGRLQADVLMSAHTSLKVGGAADIYFEPACVDEMITAIQYCKSREIPCQIIGNGSNILVSDAGVRGAVLSIGDCFSGMDWQEGLLVVKAGTKLSAIASLAARKGYSGLEFASGIPGTLGGAVFMNAGAYDHCMAEITVMTDYLDHDLILRTLTGEEHQFAYRKSFFSEHEGVILQSWLKLAADDPGAILARMADLVCRRKASQPLELPSAGSTFKRPAGCYAGKLISECGLKGCRLGDAQVSDKHAGFIVNRGQAKADDIRCLLEKVQMTVALQTGIYLEPEIKFIGDWRHWPKKKPVGSLYPDGGNASC
jgi:UDP-N-acetylmuramate dehydrogenase